VRGEVAVAEREPRVLAEALELRERRVRLLLQAPAALLVVDPGERVHDGVEVGGDGQAVALGVVADVDDDGQGVGAAVGQREGEAVGEAGAAHPAGEDGDAGAVRAGAHRTSLCRP
jgi:hypothetical protein